MILNDYPAGLRTIQLAESTLLSADVAVSRPAVSLTEAGSNSIPELMDCSLGPKISRLREVLALEACAPPEARQHSHRSDHIEPLLVMAYALYTIHRKP